MARRRGGGIFWRRGDGYDDIAVADYKWNHVFTYSGASGALIASLPNAPEPAGPVDFGYSIAAAGDINGDDVPDLVVGVPGAQPSGSPVVWRGEARVYSGADGEPLCQLAGPAADSLYGTRVAVADVDGDGVNDVVALARRSTNPQLSQVRVVSGATCRYGVSPNTIATLEGGPLEESFGDPLAGVGDMSGDCRDEFALRVRSSGGGQVNVYSVPGGDADSDGVPDACDPFPFIGSLTSTTNWLAQNLRQLASFVLSPSAVSAALRTVTTFASSSSGETRLANLIREAADQVERRRLAEAMQTLTNARQQTFVWLKPGDKRNEVVHQLNEALRLLALLQDVSGQGHDDHHDDDEHDDHRDDDRRYDRHR